MPDSPAVALPREWRHPSYYPVKALAEAAASALDVGAKPRHDRLFGRAVHELRIGGRLHSSGRLAFVPMMGPMWRVAAPWALRHELFLYCWDLWPSNVLTWRSGLDRYRIRGIAVNSTSAADLVRAEFPHVPVHVVLEAAEPETFSGGSALAGRGTQVLELGRRFERWHEVGRRCPALRAHQYQSAPGQLVFAGRDELITGLENAAVSVCFPQSVTHPEVAGTVESVTHRYFESMAAGCLILGTAPVDLVQLFGYNPVIEVDWAAPDAQLLDLLADLPRYQQLVNRNRELTNRLGGWDSRMPQLLEAMA